MEQKDEVSASTSRRLRTAFLGKGEMGSRIQSFDWSQTAFGPLNEWPSCLVTSVQMMLASHFPMIIFWSPSLSVVYNDAYVPILGAKHPQVLGKTGFEAWGEVWDVIYPMLQKALNGNASWSENEILLLHRNGYTEETYFTWSYTPIFDEESNVKGIITPVYETTQTVISERRLKVLRDLGSKTLNVASVKALTTIVKDVFENCERDIPFSLMYLSDGTGTRLVLEATTHLTSEQLRKFPTQIDLCASIETLPVFEALVLRVVSSFSGLKLENLRQIFGDLPSSWPDAATENAFVLPISATDESAFAGVLVVGVNPRRVLDETYVGFFEVLVNQLARAIATARSYEEAKKRAERLAEIDRAKTVFFSNVSHEFRTPLTLMLGPLESSIDTLSHEAAASQPRLKAEVERLVLVRRNALRLMKLVNSLLDFSRIEVNRMEALFEQTDLSSLTRELASMFQSTIHGGNLEYFIDIPADPSGGADVYVDREMWEKIVFNLLSNAFKFTLRGHIRVSLNKVDGHIILAVADTGVGIAEKDLPRMFERFYRVETTQGRSFEGTGIGLALTQELVKLHGGTISVYSELGKGSTFTVSLPLGCAHLPPASLGKARANFSPVSIAKAYVEEATRWLPTPQASAASTPRTQSNAELASLPSSAVVASAAVSSLPAASLALLSPRLQESRRSKEELPVSPVVSSNSLTRLSSSSSSSSSSASASASSSAPAQEPKSVRILLADDNADMRMYVRQILAPYWRIEVASNGEEAFQMLQTRRFDLLLSDVMMPKLDGFGLVKKVREDPELCNTPVILLSAKAGKEAEIEGLRSGADDYVVKPFSGKELIARVSNHVKLLQHRSELERRVEERTQQLQHTTEILRLEMLQAFQQEKELAEQKAKLVAFTEYQERLKEFISSICHEIRNPLHVMFGNIDFLTDALDEIEALCKNSSEILGHLAKCRDYVSALDQSCSHQKIIVDDALDYSKIEANKLELVLVSFCVQTALTNLLKMYAPQLEQKHLVLSLQLPPTLVWVRGDWFRLSQVVSNLMSNAIKFTASGGKIDVKVAFESVSSTHTRLIVSVEDTGIGMDDEELSRLFLSFTQAHPGITARYGGSGLGLVISKRLVEKMGGDLTVESRKGVGTKFTFTVVSEQLTAHDVDVLQEKQAIADARPKHTTSLPGSPAPASQGETVLVVEDMETNRNVVVSYLNSGGYFCQTAENGEIALDKCHQFHFDCILMDIDMPVMNGIVAVQTLRERGVTTPIVALSGFASAEQVAAAMKKGFTDYLPKPVRKADVLAMVKKCIQQYGSRAAERAEEKGGQQHGSHPAASGGAVLDSGGAAAGGHLHSQEPRLSTYGDFGLFKAAKPSSQVYVQAMIAQAQQFMMIIDTNFFVITANEAARREFLRVFGVQCEPGSNLLQLLKDKQLQLEKLKGLWTPALEGRQLVLYETFKHTDGTDHEYEVYVAPIRDDGGKIIGASHLAKIVERK